MISKSKIAELRYTMVNFYRVIDGRKTIEITVSELEKLLRAAELLKKCRQFFFNRFRHADLHYKGVNLLKNIRDLK